MKRLILFVIVVAIAWYGYTHYAQLRGHGMSDVVVVNQSARALDRLRVTAGNETVVIEHLEPGATATRPFRGGSDATFRLGRETQVVLGEQSWSGGTTTAGPILMKHIFLVDDRGSVIWNSEVKSEKH